MPSIIIVAISAYVAYNLGLGVYRVFFHPLARFPGPKYAALSRWHERYYDVYLGGKFIFWIEVQHRKYGPVVRIAPDELHFLDADLWETVFTKAGRVDKYGWLSGRFGNDTSVLTTAPDSLHRVRRGALNPLFSRQRILGLQNVIRKKLNILIKQLENAKAAQAPIEIQRGFGAFSEDVIMQYSFKHDYDSLSKEGWTPILHDSFVGVTIFGNTALHFPLLPKIMNALPETWIERLNPLYGLIFRMQRDFGQQIREAKASVTSRSKVEDDNSTVFSELIEGDLPDAEKADRRLQDEAQLVIAAGLVTTTWALSVGTFYLLSNPKVVARLRLELDEAIPGYDPANPTANLEWAHLEKLPYLTGVIKEAVRLSYSTASRNVRLLPKPFEFNEWTIPARTPVSMTIPFLNHDEEIFPNSRSFIPERWLGSPRTKNGSPLERYFVGFGKGTRSCLGLNLAWCELYLVFASLFRFFDLELFETDITDVELAHDFFIAFPKLDSKGVRVFVKPRN
ncbi:cytochrome P450 [Aspergillus ustus]|uniref:Cytochrome P450 n=1 Tax=Aspergillus ustus TaxID=40382 RepID=A0A0C1BWN8_ASPUT|nr:cytochrome P450 [Aspergillus ustus]